MTTNLLSPLNFSFQLSRTPELEYTAQRVSLPPVTLEISELPTPFVSIPIPGLIMYGEFSVTFLVDELMANYLELLDWMSALGHPESLDQYVSTISDASVTIMNSAKRPVIRAKFTDVVPTSLTPLEFDTSLVDVTYVPATATFKFLNYNFELL